MSIHKVVIEIEVEATNPLEAAMTVQAWMIQDNTFQFYVQDETGDMYSVDLAEENKDAILPIMIYVPLIVPKE